MLVMLHELMGRASNRWITRRELTVPKLFRLVEEFRAWSPSPL
ncbi:hypothetical protein [Streptomyces sp. NPDC059168]